MTEPKIINIGKQYSRYPVGRYAADGDSNGEKFRDDVLRPMLAAGHNLIIEFDDALGYGSSFLEEAFGGLVRLGFSSEELLARLKFVTEDESLRDEVISYIEEVDVDNDR